MAGEPLNPEAMRWAHQWLLDNGKRGFVADNWWQTELGAPTIGTTLGMNAVPGAAGVALPGVEAAVVDDNGNSVPRGKGGLLAGNTVNPRGNDVRMLPWAERTNEYEVPVSPVGNGLILGYMMWKTRLVPRAMSILGLIGGPALLVAGTAMLFGVIEVGSTAQVIATIPEFFWELSFGIWLLIWGFNPAALAALNERRP